MTRTPEPATTCQICGRAVRLVRGAIADHGYTQPWLRHGTGDGSRTRRCPGSRCAPYEVSRDAIPAVRAAYEAASARAATDLATLFSDPPSEFRYVRRDAYGRVRVDVTFARPGDFDPAAPRYANDGSIGRTYAQSFWSRQRELIAGRRSADETVVYLIVRYDAWVPPTAASEGRAA